MQQPPYSNQNDPTYTPQPFTQYPQTPYPPPPYQQPPKKRRTGLWIALGIIAVLLFACIGVSSVVLRGASTAVNSVATSIATFTPASGSTPTTAATQAQTGTWTTVQTFKGNGSKKTPTFTVPDNWRIAWTCNPSSFGGTNYNVIITVENTDGSYADSGVNSTCSKSNTHDTTNVPAGGTFILDIISEGDWTIQVQVLK